MRKRYLLLLFIIALLAGYFYTIEKTNEPAVIDDKIILFLEENLAWTNNENSKAFCSYELLGEEDNKIYLWALCEEFYVANKQIICPDEKAREDCFLSKTGEECNLCEEETVEPRIVKGGGVSVPVRLTKIEESFNLWTPRDGSLYSEDIRNEFPSNLVNKVFNPRQKDLSEINIEKAEKYFNVKAKFDVGEIFNKDCNVKSDCGNAPGEYLMLSSCPYQMKCIENKCAVGCYDFLDPQRFPIVK